MKKANFFFATLMLWRDYYVHFLTTSVPAELTVRIGGVRHALNKENAGPYMVCLHKALSRLFLCFRQELRLGLCYPLGSTINSVQYNFKTNVAPAASLGDMLVAPYNYTWAGRGTGMWYHDDASGYVWVRLIVQESQVETPTGFGGGSWVTIMSTPGITLVFLAV